MEDEKKKLDPNYKSSTKSLQPPKTEVVGGKQINDGDLFYNKMLSLRCVVSFSGNTMSMTTLEGIEVFICDEMDLLLNNQFARIEMQGTKESRRSRKQQALIDANLSGTNYNKKLDDKYEFKLPKHDQQYYAACQCKNLKESAPMGANWDRETNKTAYMVNNYIIRIDDNPMYDFVNINKSSVLWDPHWSCCRGRFDDIGCTYRKHIGPPTSNARQTPDAPDENYKAHLIKHRREDQKVIPHLTAKEMVDWSKKNPNEKFSFSKRQRDQVHKLMEELGHGVPVEMLLQKLDQIKFTEIVVFSGETHFQLKFDDVMPPCLAMKYLDDGSGNIQPQEFQKWFFGNEQTVLEYREKFLD